MLFFGVTDLLSGYEMAFSIFYMIPITFVTLVSVRGDGLAIALLSTGVWLAADLLSGHVYSHWLIPYWNTVVRGLYFVVHVMLLAWLVDSLRRQQELSGRDALTGAASRGRFVESAGLELEKARRSREPLTTGYIDLDNFKQVNDTLGHDAGDDLLRALADIVQGSIRPSDTLGRLGGDEFALLLPETGFDEAHVVLERLRLALVAGLQKDWPVTLSVGAVTFDLAPSSVESMIKRADEAMYSVKKAGKNALCHLRWPAEGLAVESDDRRAARKGHERRRPRPKTASPGGGGAV
jgi:diguanylate cyclase (GGDEF)-like protein